MSDESTKHVPFLPSEGEELAKVLAILCWDGVSLQALDAASYCMAREYKQDRSGMMFKGDDDD